MTIQRLWRFLTRPGSAADSRCAVCGVMVDPETRVDDTARGDTYCSLEHYEQGYADRAW